MALARLARTPLVALLLRNRDFATYSAGSAVSLVGMWMQRIAIGWLTWKLTRSGAWLGIVSFADFVPVVVVGPIAGAAADRWDRLRVVKISQAISLLQATALFVLAATDHLTIGLLVGLTALQGIVVAFNQPARLALVPSLVAPGDLAAAVAINSIVFNLARFIGPMLAGVAIVWSGASGAFAANAVSYLAFLLALALIRPPEVVDTAKKSRSLGADLGEGLRYTSGHAGISALLVLLTALGIGGRPLNELLPGYAADVFQAGPGGLSIMASAIGAGAICGGIWVGQRAKSAELIRTALAGALCGALSAIAVASVGRLWLALPFLMTLGFSMSVAGIAIQSLIQLATDKRMRGRVMGLYGLIFRGAPAIGALTSGVASEAIGLRWPVCQGNRS